MSKLPRAPTPRKEKPPIIKVSPEIGLGFEDGILSVITPILVNGFEARIATGIDIRKIPDDQWRRMCEARSKIALVIPSGINIIH